MATDKRTELWQALGLDSRRAISRKKWHFGRSYKYRARADLVRRLAKKFNQSEGEIRGRLVELREFILKYPQYFRC